MFARKTNRKEQLMRKLAAYFFAISRDGNIGYLLFRVFIGIGMAMHGIPKLAGGVEVWEGVGGIMAQIGVPGLAVFWGFMAALAEGVGGMLLALGALTTVASFLMAVTMAVAAFAAHAGAPFFGRELALLYFFAALMFMFKGAGRYSVDNVIAGRGAGKGSG